MEDVHLDRDRATAIAQLLKCLADLIDLAPGSTAHHTANAGSPEALMTDPVALSDMQMKLLTAPPAQAGWRDRGAFARRVREHAAEIGGQLGPEAPGPVGRQV
jgi:hypothetical protein